MLVSSAALATAACGGGNTQAAGGPTPTPTPSATASPTPTPSPTPTFSYSTFDALTGSRTFRTACTVYGGGGNGVPRADGFHWYTLDGNISYDEPSDSWTVSEINGGSIVTFDPSHLVNASDPVTYEIPGSPPSRLDIFTPMVANIPATYGRGFAYLLNPGNVIQQALCSVGVPTDPDDIPAATTITYSQLNLGGIVIDQNPAGGAPLVSQIVGGSGTITGDTTTGELTFSLFYTVRDSNGAETTLGPVSGTIGVDLGNDSAGYIGPINPGVPVYRVNGGFYGPQGRETGFVLTGDIDQDSNGINEQFILMGGYATR